MVATVRGNMAAADLGVTLMHEHLFVLDAEVRANYPEEWSEDIEIAHAVERLAQAYERGVRTVVDVTVLGLGRFIPRIIEVARRTPVNIVAATGLYTYDLVPLGFRSDRDRNGDIDLMAERFVRDIEHGISTTGVRAGALKCSSDRHGITPGIERAIRAVARAQRTTGVPVLTHTNVRLDPGGGLRQIELLVDEGVELDRVVIGHSDDSAFRRFARLRLPTRHCTGRCVRRLRSSQPDRCLTDDRRTRRHARAIDRGGVCRPPHPLA